MLSASVLAPLPPPGSALSASTMLQDNRATNFAFVTGFENITKQKTVKWGDDFTMAQRVQALGQLYFLSRDHRRSGHGVEMAIPLAGGREGAQEPTVILAERMAWALQQLSDDSDDWSAQLQGGLVDMYLKVITDSGFFTENVVRRTTCIIRTLSVRLSAL